MKTLHKIFNQHRYNGLSERYNRQYHLIHYVTWELIAACVFITNVYILARLWYLVIVIGIAVGLATINLLVLARTKNTALCSQLLAFIVFITIVITNYLIWGLGPLHSQWFYVMPLLAASLTGMNGMLIYSISSLILVIAFGQYTVLAYYTLSPPQFMFIEWVNHLFAYIIIITTLASLIHENRRYEQELFDKNYLLEAEKNRYHYLARFDQLTDLPNRRYFTQYLHEVIEALPPNYSATVFFLDIDHFKDANDRYGHNAGDQLLLETSRRLQICFREGDFIARLGGDEFTAIVLHPDDKQIPQIIAQRITHEFEHLFKFDTGIEYQFAISLGYATFPKDATSVSDLIVKADLAMYAAKKIAGNSYCEAKEE